MWSPLDLLFPLTYQASFTWNVLYYVLSVNNFITTYETVHYPSTVIGASEYSTVSTTVTTTETPYQTETADTPTVTVTKFTTLIHTDAGGSPAAPSSTTSGSSSVPLPEGTTTMASASPSAAASAGLSNQPVTQGTLGVSVSAASTTSSLRISAARSSAGMTSSCPRRSKLLCRIHYLAILSTTILMVLFQL